MLEMLGYICIFFCIGFGFIVGSVWGRTHPSIDGELHITNTNEKREWNLIYRSDPEKISKKKVVSFKVGSGTDHSSK